MSTFAPSKINLNRDIFVSLPCESICFGKSMKSIQIEKCDFLNRLLHGLKYYRSLDIFNDKSDMEKFLTFCNETYTQCLEDYIHVISTHSAQLHQIHEQITSDANYQACDIDHCKSAERYHRNDRRPTVINNTDEEIW